MTAMANKVTTSELAGILESARQRPCWAVNAGVGTFLTLEFGERRNVILPGGREKEEGTQHLWLYMTHWELESKGCSLAPGIQGVVAMASRFLTGSVITTFHRAPTRIVMEGAHRSTITLWPDPNADDNAELFLLYLPDGQVLFADQRGELFLGSGDEV